MVEAAAPRVRVAVVGAGAVGLLLGGRLARAGHRVAFLARGERLRALQRRGLHAFVPGDVINIDSPEATDSPAAIGAADVVLLCTKAYDLAAAATAAAPLVGPATLVVPIQNGVEAEAIVRRSLPAAHVVPGLVYVVATSPAPGEVHQASSILRLVFGSRDATATAALAAFEQAGREAGIDAVLASDITLRLWEKFVMLASVAAMTCLADLPLGPLRTGAETRALLERAMREVVAVGRASGVAIDDSAVTKALSLVDTLPADGTSSMHEDLRAGRRLEVDFLSGAVVRLGRAQEVDTPVHRVAWACLQHRS